MTTPPVPQAQADRDRLIELKRYLREQVKTNGQGSFGWARAVMGQVDLVLGREARNKFLSEMFDRQILSSKELYVTELFALLMWAKPIKTMAGVVFSPEFAHDLTLLQVKYQGQATIPGLS